jgi:hypothetical protein
MKPGRENEDDYIVTGENRARAIAEIMEDLGGEGKEAEAVKGYLNRLLDETNNWTKSELSGSAAAFADGYQAAKLTAKS